MGIKDKFEAKTPEEHEADRLRHLKLIMSDRISLEALLELVVDTTPEQTNLTRAKEVEKFYRASKGTVSYEVLNYVSKANLAIWKDIEEVLRKHAAEENLYMNFLPTMIRKVAALATLMLKTEDEHNSHGQVLDDTLRDAIRQLEGQADVFLMKNDPDYAAARISQMFETLFGRSARH